MSSIERAQNLEDAGMDTKLARAVVTQMRGMIDERVATKADVTLALAHIDARFAAADARFAAIDVRFAAIDARFDGLEKRFTAVEARQLHVVQEITKMKEQFKLWGVVGGILISALHAVFACWIKGVFG